MARKGKGKKSSVISVNFKGVESGGFKPIPEGRHQITVEEFEMKESSNGNDYIAFTFSVAGQKGKLFHNCSLQPQALFNLKQLLEALGFDLPDKSLDIDLSELVGLDCPVEVAHEKYEGKTKAKIVEFIAADNDSEDSDEDDESEIEELLEELDKAELKKLAKELGVKVGKKDDEDDIIENILEEDEEDIQEAYDELFGDEEDEEDEEDEDDDDEDDIDYEEMSLKELKAEARERGIKIKKGMDKDDIIELLEEDDE